jgi:hypothetical protein
MRDTYLAVWVMRVSRCVLQNDGSGIPGVTGAFTLTLPDFNHCCRDIVLWEKPFCSRYLWRVAQWVDSRLGMQTFRITGTFWQLLTINALTWVFLLMSVLYCSNQAKVSYLCSVYLQTQGSVNLSSDRIFLFINYVFYLFSKLQTLLL